MYESADSIAGEVAQEIARATSDLIAIDTTNTGGPGTAGEAVAAEYIAQALRDAGGDPVVLSAAPDRTSVILRFAGAADAARNPARAPGQEAEKAGTCDGIVVHAHLDVVPADPAEWSVDPFGGLIRDGYVWGRGAIDMKGAAAVMLTVARRWLTTGARPARDIVFAWLADEEAGGTLGAQWLCRTRPELFAGCSVAVGEVGGFSIPLGRANLYPIMTAERGHARLDVTVRAASGHGSIRRSDNPIARLAGAITALDDHRFPATASEATNGFLAVLGRLWGAKFLDMPLDAAVAALGPLGELVAPSLRHSVVPTVVDGGYAANVTPGQARATFDCRFLPGHLDDLEQAIQQLVDPGADQRLTVSSPGTASPFDTHVCRAMSASLRQFDPSAVTAPYMVSASTDAVHFAELGMQTYGFSPLLLPQGFRYGAMFHGPDERVPIDGLVFGVEVLEHFLRTV